MDNLQLIWKHCRSNLNIWIDQNLISKFKENKTIITTKLVVFIVFLNKSKPIEILIQIANNFKNLFIILKTNE